MPYGYIARRTGQFLLNKGLSAGYSYIVDKYGRKKKVPKRKGPRIMIPRHPILLTGFPKSKLVKMKYAQVITLDASAASYAQSNFKCNGLYYAASAGTHLPTTLNIWNQVYNRYTVMSAKCRMSPIQTSTTSAIIPGLYGIMLTTNNNGLADFSSWPDDVLESKRVSKLRQLGHSSQAPYQGKLSQGCVSVFSAKRFFGVRNVRDDANLSAVTNANPNSLAYFTCFAMTTDGVNNPGSQKFIVTIEYIVLVHDPLTLDNTT